jgi:hypothetical protein
MNPSKLEAVVAYLAGETTDEADAIRREVADPDSESALLLTATRRLSRRLFRERMYRRLGLATALVGRVPDVTPVGRSRRPLRRYIPWMAAVGGVLVGCAAWLTRPCPCPELQAQLDGAKAGLKAKDQNLAQSQAAAAAQEREVAGLRTTVVTQEHEIARLRAIATVPARPREAATPAVERVPTDWVRDGTVWVRDAAARAEVSLLRVRLATAVWGREVFRQSHRTATAALAETRRREDAARSQVGELEQSLAAEVGRRKDADSLRDKAVTEAATLRAHNADLNDRVRQLTARSASALPVQAATVPPASRGEPSAPAKTAPAAAADDNQHLRDSVRRLQNQVSSLTQQLHLAEERVKRSAAMPAGPSRPQPVPGSPFRSPPPPPKR